MIKMKRGRRTLLPEERHKKALKDFCLSLYKGDLQAAKKALDVIESANGKGELWNGFLWGLNGIYEASARKDKRSAFYYQLSRLREGEISGLISSMRNEEKSPFLGERERGVFEANLYALQELLSLLQKGAIKPPEQKMVEEETQTVSEETDEGSQEAGERVELVEQIAAFKFQDIHVIA